MSSLDRKYKTGGGEVALLLTLLLILVGVPAILYVLASAGALGVDMGLFMAALALGVAPVAAAISARSWSRSCSYCSVSTNSRVCATRMLRPVWSRSRKAGRRLTASAPRPAPPPASMCSMPTTSAASMR